MDRRNVQSLATACCLLFLPCSALALDIRVSPPDSVYLVDIHRTGVVFDFLVQNIVIVNDGPDTVTVASFRCDALREGTVVASASWNKELLERAWSLEKRYFDRPGVRAAEESTFEFHRLLGDSILFATGTTLPPSTAIYVMKEPFTLRMPPDRVRLTALATSKGRRLQASKDLRVIRHHTVNEYIFPVRGRWYINAASSFQSHHRWRPAHEFALDLLQIGAGGSSFRGNGSQHTDYYAFGQDVVAVADGVVVSVKSGAPETDLPRPGEDPNAFAERVLTPMWEKDPRGELAGGNAIVLRHANNEFSFYFHLRAESLRVKLGERVARGQVIAKVGMSGDGRQPHLHFQIGTSADPLTSQGIPIVFSNVRPVTFTSTIDTEGKRPLQTGEFVETVTPEP